MHIANPIYDVVFKYLMEDGKVAKLLISSIIGEEILEIHFRPQEFTTDIDKNNNEGRIGTLTVYRLDFNATIKTDNGLKNVIIEIQKAKFATDIMRFRNYLGGQYTGNNNTQIVTINNQPRMVGIPIIGIYFLGHSLDYNDVPVIAVKRTYTDLISGAQLSTKESFIESLTHDSYVIQIPSLKQNRRNELEAILSVFDQSGFVDAEHHILNIKEEDYPKKYRALIRRLQMAILEPEMRKHMELEDGILTEMEYLQRDAMQSRQETSEAKQETSEAKQETSEARQETSEARQKIAELEHEASEAKKIFARNLKSAGVALEVILQTTGLSIEEIENL